MTHKKLKEYFYLGLFILFISIFSILSLKLSQEKTNKISYLIIKFAHLICFSLIFFISQKRKIQNKLENRQKNIIYKQRWKLYIYIYVCVCVFHKTKEY